MALEVEFKYALQDKPGSPEVTAALERAGFSVQPKGSRTQKDVYFDDASQTLARAGLALRQRTVAEGEVDEEQLATLKVAGTVDGGLHQREEIEVPMLAGWPEAVGERLRGIVEVSILEPSLTLYTERHRWLVAQNGEPLAELSFDEVRAERPGHAGGARFLELELEAIGGAAEDLRRIAGALERGLSLTANTLTKPARARALLGADKDGADKDG
ncbi:MAG: CYTH domain-containing protein [Deinococcota bacterium]|nr:CYTH domain-containing protein [Deinococcota bacterium]